jgi:flagellar basal body-associated protein FliL
MKSKHTSRVLILVAGILIAAGIVLSQVLFIESNPRSGEEKAQTEQQEQPGESLHAAPTLSNHPVSVQIDQSVEASVEKVLEDEQRGPLAKALADIILPYFKTLLRTLIAPNAP